MLCGQTMLIFYDYSGANHKVLNVRLLLNFQVKMFVALKKMTNIFREK